MCNLVCVYIYAYVYTYIYMYTHTDAVLGYFGCPGTRCTFPHCASLGSVGRVDHSSETLPFACMDIRPPTEHINTRLLDCGSCSLDCGSCSFNNTLKVPGKPCLWDRCAPSEASLEVLQRQVSDVRIVEFAALRLSKYDVGPCTSVSRYICRHYLLCASSEIREPERALCTQ